MLLIVNYRKVNGGAMRDPHLNVFFKKSIQEALVIMIKLTALPLMAFYLFIWFKVLVAFTSARS